MGASAKKLWQKSETRHVRPFRSADDCLSDVGLRLYQDQEFSPLDNVNADDLDLERLALALRVPSLSSDISEIVGLPTKDLALVVSIEDRTFKLREIVYRADINCHFGESAPIDIPSEAIEAISWAGEVLVHVAVVLAKNRAGEIGTAERMGAWLAKKTFSIGKSRETSSFHIDPVEPEYFEQRGLPRNTTYYIEIADPDLNQPCESLPDLVKVSIAKDVHAALGRDESSAAAKAIERAIYVDVVTTVLATGYSNLSGEIERGSILEVVTNRLAKSLNVSSSLIAKRAKESAGAALRAFVQADSELSRSIIAATIRRIV